MQTEIIRGETPEYTKTVEYFDVNPDEKSITVTFYGAINLIIIGDNYTEALTKYYEMYPYILSPQANEIISMMVWFRNRGFNTRLEVKSGISLKNKLFARAMMIAVNMLDKQN